MIIFFVTIEPVKRLCLTPLPAIEGNLVKNSLIIGAGVCCLTATAMVGAVVYKNSAAENGIVEALKKAEAQGQVRSITYDSVSCGGILTTDCRIDKMQIDIPLPTAEPLRIGLGRVVIGQAQDYMKLQEGWGGRSELEISDITVELPASDPKTDFYNKSLTEEMGMTLFADVVKDDPSDITSPSHMNLEEMGLHNRWIALKIDADFSNIPYVDPTTAPGDLAALTEPVGDMVINRIGLRLDDRDVNTLIYRVYDFVGKEQGFASINYHFGLQGTQAFSEKEVVTTIRGKMAEDFGHNVAGLSRMIGADAEATEKTTAAFFRGEQSGLAFRIENRKALSINDFFTTLTTAQMHGPDAMRQFWSEHLSLTVTP